MGLSAPSPHRAPWRLQPAWWAPLTVPVDVYGAGIALPVVVRVDLRWVVHVGAVVASVPDLVFVVVELTGVEEKLAVVLEKKTREEFQRQRRDACWVTHNMTWHFKVVYLKQIKMTKVEIQPGSSTYYFLTSSPFIVIYTTYPCEKF